MNLKIVNARRPGAHERATRGSLKKEKQRGNYSEAAGGPRTGGRMRVATGARGAGAMASKR